MDVVATHGLHHDGALGALDAGGRREVDVAHSAAREQLEEEETTEDPRQRASSRSPARESPRRPTGDLALVADRGSPLSFAHGPLHKEGPDLGQVSTAARQGLRSFRSAARPAESAARASPRRPQEDPHHRRGPIVIGQACEFDYSGTQGAKALEEEGYQVILVNSNPATIMTDPELAYADLRRAARAKTLEAIIERERPDAILPTLGGADIFIHRIGTHSLRVGVDIRRGQQNSRLDRNLRPIAEFSGALGTALVFPNFPPGVVRGTDLASLGYVTGFLQTLIPDFNDDGRPDFDTTIGLRFTELNLFALDDWRVTPAWFDPGGLQVRSATGKVNHKIESTFTNLVSSIPAANAPSVAAFVPSFDNVVAALSSIIGGRRHHLRFRQNKLGSPYGLAWDPTGNGKVAIRGGYGIFYDQNISAVTSQSRNVFPHLLPLNSGGIGANLEGLFLTNPQYTVLREPVGVNQIRETAIVRVGSLNTMGTSSGYFRGIIGFLNSRYKQAVAFTLPTRKLLTPYAQHFHLTVEQ